MANLILGVSRCAICEESLEDDGNVVAFPWFDGGDPAAAKLSDAGVHFTCMRDNPLETQMRGVFLSTLGRVGQRPNGTIVVDVSSHTRFVFRPHWVDAEVLYAPLLLSIRAPLDSLARVSDWLDAFALRGGRTEERGLSFEVLVGGPAEHRRINVRTCGYSFAPRSAPPSTVRLHSRLVSWQELLAFNCELKRVLELIPNK